MLFVLMAVFDS